jgi:2-polyprenyl-3-methyl-5-hydroxy-6-metoxy-1,4-benzoquinol methylase
MQEFWESRYGVTEEYVYGTEPNAFLVSQRSLLAPGLKALSIADGEGRNGVWLARQELEVLTLDYSQAALAKAQALARSRGVSIRCECVDLEHWNWPRQEFDVVVSIFAHFPSGLRPRLHQAMWDALKPGGVLILEAFHPNQVQYRSGGPSDPAMLYTADLLRQDFAGAEFLHLQETTAELNEGPYHAGMAALTQMAARKSG